MHPAPILKFLPIGVAAAALLAAAPLGATTALASSLDALRASSFGQGAERSGILQLAFDSQVQRIQRGLNRLGYDAGPSDGLMGSRTRSAIEDYQRDNDLLVTGQASASLGEHIRSSVREKRAERQADSDTQASASSEAETERQTVLQLQSDLRRLGYSVPVVSGRVDSDTAQAIRAYQKDNNLLVDGRLSPELVAHIQGKASAGAVIEDRASIRSVQQALNERGYDAGPADGIMGGKTRDAIRTFQSDANLPLSGTITQETLVQLGLAAGAGGTAATGGTTTSGATDDGEAVTVISDTFGDGDYQRNPRWEVVAGNWRVSDGGALTSSVPAAQSTATQKLGPDMIKGILGNALGVQSQQQNLAAIHTRAPLANAFRVGIRLSASGEPAVLNVGPYQGDNVGYGYRLEALSLIHI